MRLPDPNGHYENGALNDEDFASYDHMFPRIRGGKGGFNLVIAHRGCNSKKGDRIPTDGEIERLEALNEARKHLFTPEHGLISPASFGEVTSSTIVLAEVLNGLEGEDSNRKANVTCRFMNYFYRDIKAIDPIEALDDWLRIVEFVRDAHLDKLHADECSVPLDIKSFVAGVMNSIIRNRHFSRTQEA